MTNPTPGTQLERVLDLMQDGRWRSPAEIAQATGDREHSVTSRIRDLRLPVYGGHQVESRKRNVTRQVWEYRLVTSQQAPNPTVHTNLLPHGTSQVWPVAGNPVADSSMTGASPMMQIALNAWQADAAQRVADLASTPLPVTGPPVKFLNMDTMQVAIVSRDRCAIDKSHGFDRVVAIDSNGDILTSLVTTQESL